MDFAKISNYTIEIFFVLFYFGQRLYTITNFLFDTVRIKEFSPMSTDFDKCDNLSKRNVKLILKIISDLEPLRGSSNKKTLYSLVGL
jgi:hypothetical protein